MRRLIGSLQSKVGIEFSDFLLKRTLSTTERSSPPTPFLAETWELLSLSRLACTPYYKHSGCKIIQCPRTPPLLDVRPRGRNQDKPCVTVLPLASSSGTRKHATFTSWDPGPRVGTPTLMLTDTRRFSKLGAIIAGLVPRTEFRNAANSTN